MRIGFAAHDPGFAFWSILSHAARKRAAELGVTLTTLATSGAAEQAAAIERLVAERVDALLIVPADSHALSAAARQANAAGIPVVAADTEILGAETACTVRSDNVRGAELAAGYLAERMGGQGELIHIKGPQTLQTARDRAEGIARELRRHPGIRVVAEAEGDWGHAAAERAARAALAAHPGARAIFAANDTMALGAIAAVEALGRAGQVLVVGFDAVPEALAAVHAGSLDATVSQAPQEIGRLALELAERAARGEALPPLVQTEVALVTRANLADAMLPTINLLPGMLRDMIASASALARERALLRTIIDVLPDANIFVKDRASRFVISNTAHLHALGARRIEDVAGKTDYDLFPHELAAQYFADEQAVMETGEALHDRVEMVIEPGGRERWYLTTKVPMRDPSGEITGVVGMSRDITTLKQAELERANLQEEVIRAQELALRELSTPLIPISDNALVMPLIGAIGSRRAQEIMETLLEGIVAHGADIAILDITGISVVDTQVANALIQAARAVKLLGAQVVLTGIRAEVAQAIVSLGVDLSGIVTHSTLQSGIQYALRQSNGF